MSKQHMTAIEFTVEFGSEGDGECSECSTVCKSSKKSNEARHLLKTYVDASSVIVEKRKEREKIVNDMFFNASMRQMSGEFEALSTKSLCGGCLFTTLENRGFYRLFLEQIILRHPRANGKSSLFACALVFIPEPNEKCFSRTRPVDQTENLLDVLSIMQNQEPCPATYEITKLSKGNSVALNRKLIAK